MKKIAIVFGFSEEGLYLSLRLLLSFYEHTFQQSSKKYDIHVFPYKCNFIITDIKSYGKSINEQNSKKEGYDFLPFESKLDWTHIPFPITTLDCSENSFSRFFLPDVAVYNDFATKFSSKFDYVLYCHNDISFIPSDEALDHWCSTLSWDTEYSIIAELRSISNYDISVRFHMCFIFVNVKKFLESSLSFVNNYKLMDGENFHVYGNGGTALLASFYAKHHKKPLWRPYIINVHGVYRGKDITTEDKWFNHVGGIEWNRSQPLSEGASVERTNREYQKARDYVEIYSQRHDL